MTDLQTSPAVSEAANIIEAARLGTIPEELELGQIYAVPQADGSIRVIDLATDDHRKRLGQNPIRKTGTVQITEAASFSLYVDGHKVAGETSLWGDRKAGRIVAVFNDHSTEDSDPEFAAGWGDHRAILTLTVTDEWKAWKAASGQLVGQTEFAEFLEDHLGDVRDPAGAELLEVATSISASSSGSFRSAIRLDNGQTQFAYDETIDARAGQSAQLAIPTRITLGLAPFEGCDPYRIEARFRYRLSGGSLRLGVVLDRPDDVVKAAFADIVGSVESVTGLNVLHGTPAAG